MKTISNWKCWSLCDTSTAKRPYAVLAVGADETSAWGRRERRGLRTQCRAIPLMKRKSQALEEGS